MRLGIDVDDVLFPWSRYAHEECEMAGITNGNEITQWQFEKDYGCTHEELWAVLNRAYLNRMLLREPIAGSVEALASLKDAGHEVHIITARGFEGRLAPLVRADTAAWLAAYEFPHDSLTFSKDKTVLKLDVAADDGPKNVIALEQAGVQTYLINSIHNQQFESAFRVASITEFAEVILAREEAA